MKLAALLASIALAAPALAEEAVQEAAPAEPASPAAPATAAPAAQAASEAPAAPAAPAAAPTEKAAAAVRDHGPELAALTSRLAAVEARLARLEAPPPAEEETKSQGLIPGFLVGPKLSILSLPTPGIGLEVKAYQLLGASFDYGLIPDLTVSGVTLGVKTWNVAAKVYPMRGSFFLGASLGGTTLSGKSTLTDENGQTSSAKLEVTTMFVAPEIGWRWVRPGGFFTGFDLGWQFPVSYKSTLSAPEGASLGTIGDVHDNADKYLKTGVPALGMLELGWFL